MSTDERTKWEQLATVLGVSPDRAIALNTQFNENREWHAIMAFRLKRLEDGKRRLYDKATPETLRTLQGEISGINQCLIALNSKDTNHEH